ncbi:asparagine synthase (glutamine-hydrolyzing) [Microvirga solisilvae]|uniref:asparagine synthase (glutamine-hydrolyzing) n=1 Tax=Microvirga solisilvae TaxID=2919498 RepID=UPI001FAEE18A|nr:asparagine synthase (glutamine-hydrolyzing) [Microvirga solisilvae]
MCGIFASAGYTPDRARIAIVAHRGPDGEGWETRSSPTGPVALGHRRLAIIDTSEAGLQPFSDRSGRFLLTYNGEIYNYRELREELIALGDTFHTHTDTEVLLAAWQRWGESALHRFVGMFAFVIWDEREKKLFAVRDRFGIKPLYWVEGQGGVAFASEIKQLLDLPGGERRMNLPRVHDFLVGGMSNHTAETMYAGIRQLRGGEWAMVDAQNSGGVRVTVRRWHDIGRPSIPSMSSKQAAETFRDLMEQSIRLHLRADVPVGACLSGGLDSSAIVGLMARILPEEHQGLHTVSACFTDKSVDERPYMEAVVRATDATPHYVFPKPEDVIDHAGLITWHQDEPFASTSIIAQWCVFSEAQRAGIKVMLDGQGSDEILAGYNFCYPYHLAHLVRQMRLGAFISTLNARRREQGRAFASQLAQVAFALAPRTLSDAMFKVHSERLKHGWLDTGVLNAIGRQPSPLRTAAESLGLPSPTDVASLCDVMTYGSNLPMLLQWEDRNSMAHSIEARVPFLDHRLVEFALGLEAEHKLAGAETKKVLRQALSDVLPQEVRDRRDKLGFATPESNWLKGPLRLLIEDGVTKTLETCPDLLNGAGVRRMLDEFLKGRDALGSTLWRVVNLGIWADRFRVTVA